MLRPSCRWTAWCCSCIASESSWRRQTASGWTSCSSYCGMVSCCRRASPPWPVCCCWRSWSSEQEAGCWAARRTSTTTARLQTRMVARTQVFSGGFADIQAPLIPPTLITKPATSCRNSSAHVFPKSAAVKYRLILPDSFLFWHNWDVVPWMWNVQ